MKEVNAFGKQEKLKGFEMIRGCVIETEPFSVENELLTPTQKAKRPVIQEHTVLTLTFVNYQLHKYLQTKTIIKTKNRPSTRQPLKLCTPSNNMTYLSLITNKLHSALLNNIKFGIHNDIRINYDEFYSQ